jgi:hypothetical protein
MARPFKAVLYGRAVKIKFLKATNVQIIILSNIINIENVN